MDVHLIEQWFLHAAQISLTRYVLVDNISLHIYSYEIPIGLNVHIIKSYI